MTSPNDLRAMFEETRLGRVLGMPVAAHRGICGDEIAENSLGSLELAVKAGVGAEIDISFLQDGRAVLFHGAVLAKNAHRDLAAVCQSSTPLCTLESALDLVGRKIPLMLELKHPSQAPVSAVEAACRTISKAAGQVVVCSFDVRIQELRPLLPGVPMGLISLGMDPFPVTGWDFVSVNRFALRMRRSWLNQAHSCAAWTYRNLRQALRSRESKEVIRIVDISPKALSSLQLSF